MTTLYDTPAAAPTARPDAGMAGKLLAMAEALTPKIAALRGNRNENTPKRQCQAMGARCEAGNLERVQVALRTLAQGWTLGTLPADLRHLRTRAEIEPLVTRIIDHPSYYVICESAKWRTETPEAESLRAWLSVMAAPMDPAQLRQAKIQALEEKIRFVPIEGFFPTPPALVSMLTARADLFEGAKVLEPSAGKGDIGQAVANLGARVQCIEINHALADICRAKGLDTVTNDFCEIPPVERYDRVIMNPPFERGQDVEHFRRGYLWLKPGGRIVSIMSASFTFARGAESFREWLDEQGAEIEDLPADSFRGAFRETGVSCKLVTLNK